MHLVERVKMAVVGCGSVSQRGILPHLSQPDIRDIVELTAVVDVVEERAKACKHMFGAKEYYIDYDEMLRKADIDAVTIATPIPLHFEQAVKAIEAGKHVHLNKTMTTTLEEAKRLIEARDRVGVKVVAPLGQYSIRQRGGLGSLYLRDMLESRTGCATEPCGLAMSTRSLDRLAT